MVKSASARWTDINSSVKDRMIQIQKIDETKVLSDDKGYYVYDFEIMNPEEEVYADGSKADNELRANPAAAVSGTNREAIHALFAKKVYVTSETDLTPTGLQLTKDDGIDLHNANTANYKAMMGSGAISPVASAMIYPNFAEDKENPGTLAAAKWSASYVNYAMQFAVPVQGSHMSRFIPLEGTTALYTAYYADSAYKALYEAGLGAEVSGYGATTKVKVPVDPAYPTAYLAANHNTAGRVTALMLPAATA